jgi:single-strand DNA-binding protein
VDFNKVILIGRLTREPEVKYLESGTALCGFGLAINRRYNGNDGEKKEEVCFVDCRAFGRQAEIIGDYVKKGNPLLVEGRLSFYSWEDEGGQKHNKLSVIAERVQLMGRKEGEEDTPPENMQPASAETEAQKSQTPSQEKKPSTSQKPSKPSEGKKASEDDIPF